MNVWQIYITWPASVVCMHGIYDLTLNKQTHHPHTSKNNLTTSYQSRIYTLHRYRLSIVSEV